MLRELFVLLISIVLTSRGAPAKKGASISPEAKLLQISELAANSKGNVITLDDATYAYYAVNKPRPYTLVVFLTASHPKFKCVVCKSLDREFQLLASSYAANIKGTSEKPQLFFVRLDYETSQRTFQSYQVASVPLIFHVGPHQGEKAGNEYDIGIRERFQVPQDPQAEQLATFLRDRTGISIKIARSMTSAYVALIVIFVIIAALVQPVINSLPFWLRIIQAKPLWIVVSAGVYTCAISGLIFDIIRSPQMYYANPQTGQIMFFYPQSGSQFVVEGFIIGFLNLMCGASLIFMGAVAPRFKNENYRTWGIVGGLIVFAACFIQIRMLYRMKNRWYGSAM